MSNFSITPWSKEDNSIPISYSWQSFNDWNLLLAHSSKGLCFLGFKSSKIDALETLKQIFPKNELISETTNFHLDVIKHLQTHKWEQIPLHLKGTDFQREIWLELLKIPKGKIKTYQDLHPNPNYARAVGTAVGSNPISIIIPCHRVINKSGKWNQYLWGSEIKKELLKLEGIDIEQGK